MTTVNPTGKIATCVDVSGASSVAQLMQISGTDWDVRVHDRFGDLKTGGFKALVRPDTNTALSFVGSRFRANSHRDQLSKLDGLVANGDILPRNVSVWDNGAIMAFQFQVPSLDTNIIGTDKVSTYLTLMHSYGFRIADSATFNGFRLFCKNQFGAFARMQGEDRVRHRGDVHGKFEVLLTKRISELGGELQGRYETMRRMAGAELKGRALAQYFGEAIGATKEEQDQAWVTPPEDLAGKAAKIPEILECYQVDDAGAPGTVWQAFNAVTRYGTHKNGRSEANRARSMLMGQGADMAARAWDAGRALAQ